MSPAGQHVWLLRRALGGGEEALQTGLAEAPAAAARPLAAGCLAAAAAAGTRAATARPGSLGLNETEDAMLLCHVHCSQVNVCLCCWRGALGGAKGCGTRCCGWACAHGRSRRRCSRCLHGWLGGRRWRGAQSRRRRRPLLLRLHYLSCAPSLPCGTAAVGSAAWCRLASAAVAAVIRAAGTSNTGA